MTQLERAVQMATEAHRGQKDRSGHDYITHPLRVMNALRSSGETAQIVGVLHDVVEDTPVPLDEIRAVFGEEVAEAVGAVSRRQGESYMEFVRRANRHPIGRLVKIEDIKDNLRPERMAGRALGMEKRYAKALKILGA